jgi:hypothetical protein
VEIDPKTFNAGRIWKVPGTLAMKGRRPRIAPTATPN